MRDSLKWLAGVAILAALTLWSNLAGIEEKLLRSPQTPMDLTNSTTAAMWKLLWDSAGIIPAGESYTVRAKDRGEEMFLFMLSMSVLMDRRPCPSSYFGGDLRRVGDRAHYAIIWQRQFPPAAGERLTADFRWGCLYRRQSP